MEESCLLQQRRRATGDGRRYTVKHSSLSIQRSRGVSSTRHVSTKSNVTTGTSATAAAVGAAADVANAAVARAGVCTSVDVSAVAAAIGATRRRII